jgi:hypothetical protein
MSRNNGEKGRANIHKKRRTAMRVKTRAARAEAAPAKAAPAKAAPAKAPAKATKTAK